MYEAHFGLTGTPFSLHPDPAFYFQSKGHGNALSYLRFGVYQGEGFVVVTGEIGAGKTMLVRTLLAELDDREIVAAQIVSTQLEAGDLLRSVAIAFGLPPKNLSKAELIASIEAFLTLLVTQNKRALLIVDEAQNLNLQAIEELRMLSNFQLGAHALLQSFLVGQPELRKLLMSKPMEQFRQRVIASCHLGPMDAQETRAYIEHRLQKVGWTGRPSITTEAYQRVFERTTGIPRRVNLLCNRVLLSAFLASQEEIDVSQVDTVADDAYAEVGPARSIPGSAPLPSRPVSAQWRVDSPAPASAASVQPRAPLRESAVGPMMCVAANRTDDIKMAMLLRAMQLRPKPPALILVRIGAESEFALNDAFYRQIGVDVPTIELPVSAATPCAEIFEVMRKFEPLIDLHKPAAVVVIGQSDAMLACGLVASKLARPLAFVEEGSRQVSSRVGGDPLNRRLLESLAQLRCPDDRLVAAQLPGGAGPAEHRAPLSLLSEAALLAASAAIAPGEILAKAETSQQLEFEEHGYCIVEIAAGRGGLDRNYLMGLLGILRSISKEIPLVWSLPAAQASQLDSLGLRKMIRGERIALLSEQGYAESVALMAGANCVLTDCGDVQIEAVALQVPCFMLDLDEGHADAEAHGIEFLKDMRGGVSSVRGGLDMATLPDVSARHRGSPAAELMADNLANWIEGDTLERWPAEPQLVG